MKKVLLSCILLIIVVLFSNKMVFAEDLSYPFDTITIVEAKKFDIVIPANVAETSLLYGKVEANDLVTVFIARIVMKEIGSEVTSESTVLILSDAEETDILRYLINNFYQEIGVQMSYGFASHILIDSTMGVFKDMSLIDQMKEIGVTHMIATNELKLIDNTGLEIPMVENSFELRTDLNMVIAVNQGTN